MDEVVIGKLVHGGQGLGTLPDGRKVFVWNALPGETVRVRLIKQKRSYAEAIAEAIVVASPERIEPLEANYLATSPWQMMTFEAENRYKADIVKELYTQAKLDISPFIETTVLENATGNGKITLSPSAFAYPPRASHYRNKMEYSFWGDEDGLHLALHQRGSHGKQIVSGSALALPAVDVAARVVLAELTRLKVRAGDLKTLVVRCDQYGAAVAALFVKPSKFPRLKLPSQAKPSSQKDSSVSEGGGGLRGLRVYHSNPKSPASVRTKLIYELGDCGLADSLLGKVFHYDVDSFFQVNVPVYEQALETIRTYCQGDPVDMYAGVGTIGLSVAKKHVTLVELDPATAAMARLNASRTDPDARVVEASTEKALEYITAEQPVIFDPPRAGLHASVVKRCLEAKPPQIIYLSCNPATQARDLALLQAEYAVKHFTIFNFFPRTPHIETLVVLEFR
ncbi:class I SAM-dependent RNA methyltransferase [Candidatus Saccharibacteria bacterium]|nr:MAG: class I SAM-dependent RNA methyltransferase [Candidatus Saccharibacteria bacterium]